jgi:zinc protease
LGDRVREEEGLSYYVGSGVIISPEDANGIFYMQATSAPENMVRVEAAMREELQRFVRDGVTAQELEDSKAGLLSSYRDGRSNDGSIASSLRTNLYLGRTMQWDADFEGAVSRLTQEQVNEAIRRRLKPEIVSTFVAGDFAAGKKRIVLSK